MSELLAELRHALRRLSGTPGAALTAVAALAIGIGMPTLLFGLIDGALLTTLPFESGERIVRIVRAAEDPVTVPEYLHWSERQRSFEGLGAIGRGTVALAVEGQATEPARSATLEPSLLPLLGVQPALGRGLGAADAEPGAPSVVLIGHELWRSHLEADPAALGRTVRVNGAPAEIVGVMPEGFGFPLDEQLWMPLRLDALRAPEGGESFWIVGVLREGVTLEAAGAELRALDGELEGAEAGPAPSTARVVRYTDLFGDPNGTVVLAALMLGVAFLVLLVACANAANVLLARAAVRGREVAIRAALGASRARIAAAFWTEVLLLAVLGAAGGVALAALGVRIVRDAMPATGRPFWIEIALDPSVLGFVAGAALLAAFLAGVLPALQASGAGRHELLKEGGRGGSSRRLGRIMGRLIGVEMAVSFVLLVAAGLFVRSAVNLQRADFAFEPEGVYTARVRLPEAAAADPAAGFALTERLQTELEQIPGAAFVALTTQVPGVGGGPRFVSIEGIEDPDDPSAQATRAVSVTPGFFEIFHAPMVAGRAFDDSDVAGSLPVAIVNTAFERRYLPGGALQRRVALDMAGGERTWLTVVGVVPDLMAGGLVDELDAAVYRPLAQDPRSSFQIVVRPASTAVALAQPVRETVRRLDPDIALFDARPLQEVIEAANAQFAWLGALFLTTGALALFLAAVGLYGVMAFWVAQRTSEIGIRMALGGQRARIVRLVLRQGMTQTLIGLGVGALIVVPLGRLLSAALFRVPPYDPLVLGSVLGVLVGAAWLGCWIPALRATRVDPLEALTAEGG